MPDVPVVRELVQYFPGSPVNKEKMPCLVPELPADLTLNGYAA